MNKQILGLALIGLAASANAWTVNMADLDDWGTAANGTNTFVVAPDADYVSGGSSRVLAADGSCIGFCGDAIPNDISDDVWGLAPALTGGNLTAQLKVTAYVPASASGWGWATAGFYFIPNGVKVDGKTWLESAESAGLTATSNLSLKLSYSAGKKITVQYVGPGVYDNASANDAAPRKEITGTGAMASVSMKATDVKKATWVTDPTYKNWDITKVNAVALLRIVSASAAGAPYPSTEPATTDLSVGCISIDATGCGGTIPVIDMKNGAQFSVDQNVASLVGGNVEVLNANGQVLASGESVNTASLEKGVYFVRGTIAGETSVQKLIK